MIRIKLLKCNYCNIRPAYLILNSGLELLFILTIIKKKKKIGLTWMNCCKFLLADLTFTLLFLLFLFNVTIITDVFI